jgi:hypothetical protein
VPSDEELRRVGEDLRALARSLARDLWEATRADRAGGRPAADALRRGLHEAADGLRREMHRAGRRGGRPPYPYGYERYMHGYDRYIHVYDRYRQGHGRYMGGGKRRGGDAGESPVAPAAAAPPAPVRRSWDGAVLGGILTVLFGTAWLLGAAGVIRLPVEVVLAAGLMLVGGATVVTGRTDWGLSRHLWPMLVGGLLVLGLLATSSTYGVGGALAHPSAGQVRVRPTGTETVYGGLGRLQVDASGVRPGTRITIETLVGQTVVTTPPGQGLSVHADVLAGQVCIDGQQYSDGVGASAAYTRSNGGPSVEVDVHQLGGQLVVNGPGCARR